MFWCWVECFDHVFNGLVLSCVEYFGTVLSVEVWFWRDIRHLEKKQPFIDSSAVWLIVNSPLWETHSAVTPSLLSRSVNLYTDVKAYGYLALNQNNIYQ